MKRRLKRLCIFAFVLVLSACASQTAPPETSPVSVSLVLESKVSSLELSKQIGSTAQPTKGMAILSAKTGTLDTARLTSTPDLSFNDAEQPLPAHEIQSQVEAVSMTNAPVSASVTAMPAKVESGATADPAPEPMQEAACVTTERRRLWPLGNSGMEFMYSDYGGEAAAMDAAEAWGLAELVRLQNEGNSWVAFTITPLMWSDDEYHSCTLGFY